MISYESQIYLPPVFKGSWLHAPIKVSHLRNGIIAFRELLLRKRYSHYSHANLLEIVGWLQILMQRSLIFSTKMTFVVWM